MGEYDSPGRPLPWYLRFSELPENTTEDDTGVPSSFVWPEDPDERTLVLFSLSQREWTVLGSSIDVGRDIAYGADSIRVLWLWLRNMRENVAICSAIIDCLTNDEDTQQALADLITNNEIIGRSLSDFLALHPGGTVFPKELPLPPGELTKNITIPNPDCDPDLLYAQCVGIVQTANRMTEDFLETWETYTNSAETIPAIVLSVPLLGEAADVIGIDGIADYANSIIDAIKENYDDDYTLDYENELACQIFCAAKGDCTVTLEMLTGIMNARISGQLTLTNGIELLLSLIDADISGINVADLYLCAFFNMLTLANLVLPITWGIESYLRVTRTFNTPNDDWMVLCTDCPDVCFVFTTPGSAGGWVSVENPVSYLWAQHFNTHGWSSSHGGATITDPVTNTTFWIEPSVMPSSGNVTVQLTFSASVSPVTIKTSWADGGSVLGTSASSGAVQTIHGIDLSNGISVYLAGYPDGVYLEEICYS